MSYLKFAPWALLGLFVVAAGITVFFYKAEAEVAKAHVVAMQSKLEAAERATEVERSAMNAAEDATRRQGAENAEQEHRHEAAEKTLRDEAEKYRQELRACQTPEAVAERLGNLFPIGAGGVLP